MFAENLFAIRTRQNMTHKTLSEKLGVSTMTISRWENGKCTPTIKTISKIAEVLGVTANDLLSESESDLENRLEEIEQEYGRKVKLNAEKILESTAQLFYSGELDDASKDKYFQSILDIYIDSKNESKKYTPKKYL